MVNQTHFHLTVGVFTYLLVRSCCATYLSSAAICCIEISSYWFGLLNMESLFLMATLATYRWRTLKSHHFGCSNHLALAGLAFNPTNGGSSHEESKWTN